MSHVFTYMILQQSVQASSVVKIILTWVLSVKISTYFPFYIHICYRECEYTDLVGDYVNSLVTHIPCNAYMNSSVGWGHSIRHRDVWPFWGELNYWRTIEHQFWPNAKQHTLIYTCLKRWVLYSFHFKHTRTIALIRIVQTFIEIIICDRSGKNWTHLTWNSTDIHTCISITCLSDYAKWRWIRYKRRYYAFEPIRRHSMYVLLASRTCNYYVWSNVLSRICQSIEGHFKHLGNTVIATNLWIPAHNIEICDPSSKTWTHFSCSTTNKESWKRA